MNGGLPARLLFFAIAVVLALALLAAVPVLAVPLLADSRRSPLRCGPRTVPDRIGRGHLDLIKIGDFGV